MNKERLGLTVYLPYKVGDREVLSKGEAKPRELFDQWRLGLAVPIQTNRYR
jgi:hypothetical protein